MGDNIPMIARIMKREFRIDQKYPERMAIVNIDSWVGECGSLIL
jgi:hypothetical protein